MQVGRYPYRFAYWIAAATVMVAIGPIVASTIEFVEVGAAQFAGSNTAFGMTTGLAAADFDDDGDVDVFLPTAGGEPNRLFVNDGNGSFVEQAAEVGLASFVSARSALWFDYDGDHDLDLAIAGDCWPLGCPMAQTFFLYKQVSPTNFIDVTATAGLTGATLNGSVKHFGGLAAGDLNNDGYLDLYVSRFQGGPRAYLNNRNGAFIDVTIACGVVDDARAEWQPMFHDFNHDGWSDVYVAVDGGPNILWINQHDGTFVDTASAAGLDNAMNDMGVALGDYDDDGDFDICVTNIFENGKHNVLFRNDSTPAGLAFVEISNAAGVDNGFWGWGATFFDADHDGRLDLGATNGFDKDGFRDDPSRLFLNAGGDPPTFTDASAAANFDDTDWCGALIALDHDRDGDLDLMQSCLPGPLRLMSNQPAPGQSQGHYIVVKPRMNGPNHRAIGAVIHADIGDKSLMRLITAGTSFAGQEPAEAHFGLPTNQPLATITIHWPDGSASILSNVVADQVLTVWHAGFGDLDADNDIDLRDYAALQRCFAGVWTSADQTCRPADFDGDTDCDQSEVATFVNRVTGPN